VARDFILFGFDLYHCAYTALQNQQYHTL